MNQEQVKRFSTLVAAHMSCVLMPPAAICFDDDVKPEEIRKSWEGWPLRPCALMLSHLL
jgi:hypothetical protein